MSEFSEQVLVDALVSGAWGVYQIVLDVLFEFKRVLVHLDLCAVSI